MQLLIITFILFVFIAAVYYCDIRYQKIYNRLLVPFFVIGLALNTCFYGVKGLWIGVLGSIAGSLILLLPYIWGWIGGGDLKFLASAGAFVGPLLIVYSVLLGLVLFGVAALIYLISQKRLGIFLSEIKSIFLSWNLLGIFAIKNSGSLPFGIFLGAGVLLVWIWLKFYML